MSLDVCHFWQFVNPQPCGPIFSRSRSSFRISINWFMPPIGPSSGGHLNIFRFLLGLMSLGFDCRVVIVYEGTIGERQSPEQISKDIQEWYGDFSGGVYIWPNNVPQAEVAMATGWQTAHVVRDFRGSLLKSYFIQDYEPMFYSSGSEALFAEATYNFGFVGFTAGHWLAEKLAREYGMRTIPLGFSYDKQLYVRKPRRDDTSRVFFYARPVTQRRGFEIGVMALQKLHEIRPDVEFVLAGWDVSSYKLPFPYVNSGTLPVAELPDVYSQCSVALVLSFTNLSLLPAELMACGSVVVSNKGPNVEWFLNPSNSILANPNPTDLAQAMSRFFELPASERARWEEVSMKAVSATDWGREIRKLADGITDHVALQSPAPAWSA